MKKSCVIVDYGLGNIFSVARAVELSGMVPTISRDQKIVSRAERLILPGVGAFGSAMQKIRYFGLDNAIFEFLEKGRPFLGICVGMQVLFNQSSEFGVHKGLGVLNGTVNLIDFPQSAYDRGLRVPIIGWHKLASNTNAEKTVSELTKNIAVPDFYFVHSFMATPTGKTVLVKNIDVFNKRITALVESNNVFGVQFHPERSAENGQLIFRNFMNL
ncbi:MAG: imidazole glycerol phosphate synthase subunit HisH [Paracoccaceae bacterium]